MRRCAKAIQFETQMLKQSYLWLIFTRDTTRNWNNRLNPTFSARLGHRGIPISYVLKSAVMCKSVAR